MDTVSADMHFDYVKALTFYIHTFAAHSNLDNQTIPFSKRNLGETESVMGNYKYIVIGHFISMQKYCPSK